MNWGQFKQLVDEKIIEELGAGFDENNIEIDWIDISCFFNADVTIDKSDMDNVKMQVSD